MLRRENEGTCRLRFWVSKCVYVTEMTVGQSVFARECGVAEAAGDGSCGDTWGLGPALSNPPVTGETEGGAEEAEQSKGGINMKAQTRLTTSDGGSIQSQHAGSW